MKPGVDPLIFGKRAGIRCGLLAALLLLRAGAQQVDPLNCDWPAGDLGKVLSRTNAGAAISGAAWHRGLLFVPLGADHGGGQGAGAFNAYDLSDPASPEEVFDSRDHAARYHTAGTLDYVGDWAELHHLPISGDLMAISERRNGSAGIAIFDLAPLYDGDPTTLPRTLSRMSFSGVTSPSNYDGYSFALGWQGSRWVYAPTGSNGLYIVDTANLEAPVQAAHLSRAAVGNVTHRTAWPIGNLLILAEANVQSSFQARIFDISNPVNPVQVGSFTGPFGYHGFVYGGSFYGGGTPVARHDFSNPASVVRTDLHAEPGFDRSEYGYGRDGKAFIGHYPGATVWTLQGTDPHRPTSASPLTQVNSGMVDDHAFLNPVGNLVMLCTDHNNPDKFILGVADTQKDTTSPQPLFTSPSNGAVNQHVRSRVGISFSDFIDPTSLDESTLQVREVASGTVVQGSYSAMQGIVNFVPDQNLAQNTTYEVRLIAAGVKDQNGNAVTTTSRVLSFSTGDTLNTFEVEIARAEPVPVHASVTRSITVTNPSGMNLEHSFDWGDGSISPWSAATSASHDYSQPGNFAITVRSRVVGSAHATGVNGVQVVHLPIAASAPVSSGTIVSDPSRSRVWCVNPDNDSVSAVDPESLSRILERAVGDHPVALALGPSDRLWVVNEAGASLTVLNRADGAVVATHVLPPGSSPRGIVIDQAAGRAYVSLEALGEVVRVNCASGEIEARLAVGTGPRGLALDPQRGVLWVSRFISPDQGGVLRRIDLAGFTAGGVTPLAFVTEPDSLTNGRGLPNYLMAPVLSPDLSQGWVPAKKDNIGRGLQRDGQPLTFEFTVRSMAAALDLASAQENPAKRLDFDNSDFATAAAFSPWGNQVFFATSGSRIIWVIDAWNPASRYSFESGGGAPDGLALNAEGTRLFVHNFTDRSVSVFRVSAACAGTCGTSPLLGNIATVGTEALSAQVLHGKQLFYETADTRLAQEGYMSCASCHLDGGHDGRTWDFASLGEGLRNTIELNGRGFGHGPLHWSANFDEAQDFEGQIRTLVQGTGLMEDAVFHAGDRANPLGQSSAQQSADLDALAAYLASLTTVGRSPHRAANGSLTEAAAVGREIFVAENCASCHGGSAFSDSASLARHEVGTLTPLSGNRLGGALDGIDTPTLRGLWKTAPFLHDGSAATLEEVFRQRDLSGRHAGLFHRSDEELGQLVAYLNSIDDLEEAAPAPTHPSAPPLVVTPAAQSGAMGSLANLALAVSGGQGPLHWEALGLPPGLAIDPDTGRILGAAAAAGRYRARVAVRDAAGRVASVEFDWIVNDPLGFRFVRLESISTWGAGNWSSMAEFNLLGLDGQRLERTGWAASASSEETGSGDNRARWVLDGQAGTLWHTEWDGLAFPHSLVIDLGVARRIGGFQQLPRQDGTNGRIRGWRLYLSNDPQNWGNPVANGQFPNSAAQQQSLLGGDVNQEPRIGTPLALTIPENAVVGTVVGSIPATDPEGGALSWSLGAGNGAGRFAIDAAGIIRVAGSLDFELTPRIDLQVIVSDSGSPARSAAVSVPVRVLNVIETQAEAVQWSLTTANGAPFAGQGNPALVDFDADPDGDGLGNAMELLFGTDPATADRPLPFEVEREVVGSKTHLVYLFRTRDTSGLTPRVLGSGDLQVWEPFPPPQRVSQVSGLSTWRARDPVALEDSPQRFMRLELLSGDPPSGQ